MQYQGYEAGLYLVVQRSVVKSVFVQHWGILDVGNRLNAVRIDRRYPTVIHQTPPRIRLDSLTKTGGWLVLGRIVDEAYALHRIRCALADPEYGLFGHNCEHFARYVATGIRESKQLQGAGIVVALVGILWAAAA